MASLNGYTEVVKLLVDKGANVDTRNKEGVTPLLAASCRGRTEIVKLLIDRDANVHIPSKSDETPLLIASFKGHTEIVRLLIGRGANVDIPNKDGETPLYIASLNGYTEVARLLIDGGANVDIPNKDGVTPLSSASFRGHTEIVRLLIDRDANVHIPSKSGETPLLIASFKGLIEVARLLIGRGANVDIPNKEGEAPLLIASNNGHTEIVRLLIDGGAKVDIPNKDGVTPLSSASFRGHTEIVRLLIGRDANVHTPNKEGETPLLLASYNGHTKIVRLLIDRGANVDTPSKNGTTPLIGASFKGHIEIVRLLIDRGANVDILNNDGETPLYIASFSGHSGVVKLLVEKRGKLVVSDFFSVLLAELNPFLIKLAEYQDPQIILIRHAILEYIKDRGMQNCRSVSCVRRSIENEETKVLMRELSANRYGDLSELLKKKQQIERLLAKAKREQDEIEVKKQSGLLKKLEKATFDGQGNRITDKISSLREDVEKARKLIKEGKIQEAKGLLEVDLRKKLTHNAVICSFLVGMMGQGLPWEDVELIVDGFSQVRLEDVFTHRTVVSAMYSLFKMGGLYKSEKIAILKKVITPLSEEALKVQNKKAGSSRKNLQKDFLKSISTLGTLAKLNKTCFLKEFIHIKTENPTAYLKNAFNKILESEFGPNLLCVDNLFVKYGATFGNVEKFRDPSALFDYLGSLNTINPDDLYNVTRGIRKDNAIGCLSIYVKDVLEGNFTKNRYDLKQNLHLKKIFESKPELLEIWKKNKSTSILKSAENRDPASSKINYLEFFKQKIATDKHLGEGWEGKYPFLFQGLAGEDIEKVIANLEGVRAEVRGSFSMNSEMQEQKVETLEAQKLLLLLCKNDELDRDAQIELLKKTSQSFVGTEFQNDLNGFITSLTSSRSGSQDTSKYTICDTDDACDILLMGHEILGSCQRLNGDPRLNVGLLGPLLDGKYRIIAIKDENGKMVARCLLKILWDEAEEAPVLFRERIYVNQSSNLEYHSELLNEMCKKKAQAMGLPLLKVSAGNSGDQYPYPVESLGGRSPFEYVDALVQLKVAVGVVGNTYEISSSSVIWEPDL